MPWFKLKKEDLLKAVRKVGVGSTVEAAGILELCKKSLEELFGEDTAKEIRPLFFRHNTITIRASSPVIAQEVKLREHELVNNINQKLGKEEVRHIAWKINT